jgi:hypothetical protein
MLIKDSEAANVNGESLFIVINKFLLVSKKRRENVKKGDFRLAGKKVPLKNSHLFVSREP